MDPLAIFGDIRWLEEVTRYLERLKDRRSEGDLSQCVYQLERGLRRLKISAEALSSAYDDAVSRVGVRQPETCPECGSANYAIRGRGPYQDRKHVEIRTYLCGSCGHTEVDLYGKSD